MKKIFYLIFILFCGISAFSQTNTWIGGNANWNTAGNWTLGIVPTAAHDVVINTSSSISVNVTPPNLRSLTITNNSTVTFSSSGGANRVITITNAAAGFVINTGSSLTLTGTNPNGGTTMGIAFTGAGALSTISGGLTLAATGTNGSSYNATNSLTNVSGTITNSNSSSTITSTTTDLNFNVGGTYVHAYNGGSIPTATWNAASNCNITGITNSVPAGLSQAFGNFTWNCPNHSTLIRLNGALTTVNGNFTVSDAGNFQNPSFIENGLSLTSNTNLNMTVGGNFLISNAIDYTWLMLTDGNAAVNVTVGGNFNITGNTTYFLYHFASTSSVLNDIVIDVAGNFSHAGTLFDFAYTTTTGAVNQSLLYVGGNFSHTTGVIRTSTTDGDIPNGKIIFDKSGTQTFNSTTPANIFYTNYEIASGSTLELLSGVVLTSQATPAIWGGKFFVNSGGILDAGTNQIISSTGLTVGFNNEFTLNSGAGIITANVNGIQNSTIGSISTSIATRTFSSGANYTFDGTAIQNSGIFTTTPIGNQVNKLTVNNTAGKTTTGVTLQQPFAVDTSLTLTNGHITTTSTNILTMNAISIVSGQNYGAIPRQSGSTDSSFVNGPMRKIGNTNFLFPLGKINAGNHFCGISSPALVTDTYTAEYIRGSATLLGPITSPGLSHVSNCEYWTITTTAASPNVNVTLSWNGFSNCNFPVYVSDLATLRAAHFGTTSWDSYGGTIDPPSNTGSGSITWNNVTSFSPFSLGSTSGGTNPLQVQLVNVKAYRTGDKNKIDWTNLSETDVVVYEVERSVTGTRFVTFTSMAARSNANDKEDYYVYDLQIDPITYYRIKIINQGGRISYSPVVKVTASADQSQGLIVYPNPVTGNQFTLQMNSASGIYNIKIYAANGQLVKTEVLNHPGGAFSKTIELPGHLKTGQYLLHVTGGEKILTTKLIKL